MSRKRQHAAASVQEETYTYWPGPRFTCVEVITTKTIVRIIDRLYSAFGPGYEFEPEPITEGGIQMTNWPGRVDHAFKTFRFAMWQPYGKWPWIQHQHGSALNQWRHADAVTIWTPEPRKTGATPTVAGALFLKAFFGAPCWSHDELRMVMHAMHQEGMSCMKSKLPGRAKLVKVGDLGKRVVVRDQDE